MSSSYSTAPDMWIGLSAILSLAAAMVAWRSQGHRVARSLLLGACVISVVAIMLIGKQCRCRPFSSATVAMAAISAAAGLWGLSPLSADHHVQVFTSLLLALTLGAYLLAPRVSWAGPRVEGWWFALAEVLHVLSAGALVLGSACSVLTGSSFLAGPVGLTLALALLCQTGSLVAHGIGAQLAWGAYWSWDPVECWHLAPWLATAMAVVGARSLGWDLRQARWALLATTGFVLVALLGAFPLVHLLGLQTRYLAP